MRRDLNDAAAIALLLLLANSLSSPVRVAFSWTFRCLQWAFAVGRGLFLRNVTSVNAICRKERFTRGQSSALGNTMRRIVGLKGGRCCFS